MIVYVVGWHPSVGSSANGGFEWRYGRREALKELAMMAVHEASNDGPAHNLVYAKVAVPFEIDPERPRTYSDREGEITAWLDANLELIELPSQELD